MQPIGSFVQHQRLSNVQKVRSLGRSCALQQNISRSICIQSSSLPQCRIVAAQRTQCKGTIHRPKPPRLAHTLASANPEGDSIVPKASISASNVGGYDSDEVRPETTPFLSPKNRKFLIIVAVGLALWNIPPPAGVEVRAMHLLSIFVSTVVGIVLQPIPLGAIALMGLGVSVITQTLTVSKAFFAYGTEVPWLIAIAMFLSYGFRKTGLGQRLAYFFVTTCGSTPMGLTYSLIFSETLLGPTIPSVAARSGGIFLPLIRSLAEACGSRPGDGTERKIGAYLIFTLFYTSAITSAMFLTANHPSPLCARLTEATIGKGISWAMWAKCALLPGITSLILLPIFIRLIYPFKLKDTSQAQTVARQELESMGDISSQQLIMAAAVVVTVGLWVIGGMYGVSTLAAALIGVSILLLTEVITWDECLSQKSAWNTYTWYAALIAMATELRNVGLIEVFAKKVSSVIASANMSWQFALIFLACVYYYCHYVFASNIAHVSAMFVGFLTVAIGAGAPPMVAALAFSYISNLQGVISHYGMSHGPMYYGQGYIGLGEWLGLAFKCSIATLSIWSVVGGAWWKYLGLY